MSKLTKFVEFFANNLFSATIECSVHRYLHLLCTSNKVNLSDSLM